jgi:uncharacterized protein YndB with AHSA1/START domain
MATSSNSAPHFSDDVVITGDIEARRPLVFEAWTNPRHVARWWGPLGFSNARCEIDLRPGGAIRIDLVAPDGTLYPVTGFFQEIIEPEKLIFSTSPVDGLGHPLLDVLNTVTFGDNGNQTKITIEAQVLRSTEESEPYLAGLESGWMQSLERLNTYLARRMPIENK